MSPLAPLGSPVAVNQATLGSRGDAGTWILLPPDELPASLADRAELVALVWLRRTEARRLFGGAPVQTFAREDRAIVDLLAEGATVRAVARRLGMSERTVYRRLARVREKLGAVPPRELAARLNLGGASATDDSNEAVGVRGTSGYGAERNADRSEPDRSKGARA